VGSGQCEGIVEPQVSKARPGPPIGSGYRSKLPLQKVRSRLSAGDRPLGLHAALRTALPVGEHQVCNSRLDGSVAGGHATSFFGGSFCFGSAFFVSVVA
jgi:hypothetical protein